VSQELVTMLDISRHINQEESIVVDSSRDILLTDFGKATLRDRYLLPGEDFQGLFSRVSSYYGDDKDHAQRLYDYMSKHWFMPATPILSNGGTLRGLPISCFLNEADDSLEGIVDLWVENVWLAAKGGGLGSYWGNLRSIGEAVGKNGKTSGIIPFIRVMDSMTLAISQGSLRRGSAAVYLPISHPEIEEFIEIRRPTGGDPNRKALNLHHGIFVPDAFMEAVEKDTPWALTSPKTGAFVRNISARALWVRILTSRIETGEPYLVFSDTVNNAQPLHNKLLGLEIKTSNLCLTGDTVVAVADGRNGVSIKQLAQESQGAVSFPVYSGTKTANGKRTIGRKGGGYTELSAWAPKIKNAVAFKTGTQKVVKITLNNGDSFRVTPNHKLMTIKGEEIEAEHSLGQELEPFYSYTGKNKESPYRHIKSLSAASAKQHIMIHHFHRPDDWTVKGEIDHIDSKAWPYDTITNLQQLSECDHMAKVAEEMSNSNPMNKVNKDYIRKLRVAQSTGVENPRFSGIDNFMLIDLCKRKLSEIREKDHEPLHVGQIYDAVRLDGLKLPWTFSKYRFGGGKEGWDLFSKYVYGELTYDGAFEVKQEEPNYWEYNIDNNSPRIEYINKYLRKTVGNTLIMTGLIVTSVEDDGVEDVYDLKVEDNHNFYIITSTEDDRYENCQGVLVHNCSEIVLPTGRDHLGKDRTAICCLSSLNIERWDEWHNNKSFIPDIMRFLDNVLQDFIDRAPKEMSKAIYSATRERSVGLGVMGWHSFLQTKNIPFESVVAKSWNIRIFKHIQKECDKSSRILSEERGPCLDAQEVGISERFSHKTSIAPTASISIIAGNSSPGIEPLAANVFLQKTLSGSFTVRNLPLTRLLKSKGMDNEEIWTSITLNKGSVQHLDFLDEHEKMVYKTAFELDQRWIVEHAADRTPYIDQSQSVNIFLPANIYKRDLHKLHMLAWKKGLKSLYYCRSLSIQRADSVSTEVIDTLNDKPQRDSIDYDTCLSCQ